MNTKHVTNLELSKALFEAGITKDFESEFYWTEDVTATFLENGFTEVQKNGTWVIVHGKFMDRVDLRSRPECPALLLSELLELIPKTVVDDGRTLWPTFSVSGTEYTAMLVDRSREVRMQEVGKTPLDVTAKLATYLLREGKFNKPATK